MDEERAGMLAFVTDLAGMAFSEDAATPVRLEVCRDGRWQHPSYGEIVINADTRAAFEANFAANVRRVGDLPLDYDHEPGPAPGWITGLRSEGKSLFADVRLTPEGRRRVESGEYRFFSPEWHPDWEDPEGGEKHGPTLFGGALTNRPFFRGMQAIACAEITTSRSAAGAAGGAPPTKETAMAEETTGAAAAATQEALALQAAETRQMRERMTALEAENAALRAKEERAELVRTFSEMRLGERAMSLAPVSRDALTEALVGIPEDRRKAVIDAISGLQLADLREVGFQPAPQSGGSLTAAEESAVESTAKSLGVSVEEARQKFIEVKKLREERRMGGDR